MKNAPILGSIVGTDRTWGALEGRTPARPLTFGRLTTDDNAGAIRAYVGEGSLTDDPLKTFGNRAVAHIPRLQELMRTRVPDGDLGRIIGEAVTDTTARSGGQVRPNRPTSTSPSGSALVLR